MIATTYQQRIERSAVLPNGATLTVSIDATFPIIPDAQAYSRMEREAAAREIPDAVMDAAVKVAGAI